MFETMFASRFSVLILSIDSPAL